MTSGSIAGTAHSREPSMTRKRDDSFVIPSAATRTNSIASASRVGASAAGRSTSAGGTVVARSMTARKNEMEVKVSSATNVHDWMSRTDGDSLHIAQGRSC